MWSRGARDNRDSRSIETVGKDGDLGPEIQGWGKETLKEQR